MPKDSGPAAEAELQTRALVASEDAMTSGPVSEKDWTGYYTITLIVLKTPTDAAKAALPKGLKLDESYGAKGWYPILASFGTVENARPWVGGGIGFNYYESFSAIPGVQLEKPNGGHLGPYLYPYRGYLDHFVPVLLGRFGGFRKYWERISVYPYPDEKNAVGFRIRRLLSTEPIIDGKFVVDQNFGLATINPRVRRLRQLLPPHVVGINLLGKLVRNFFFFDFDNGIAWNIGRAQLRIHVADFIPGYTEPIEVDFPEGSDKNTKVLWTSDDRYPPVRAFVPWRLISGQEIGSIQSNLAELSGSPRL